MSDTNTVDEDILNIDSLSVEYTTPDGSLPAVRDFSMTIREGETMGIAGESGSGKSTLALAILQYLGKNGRIMDGSITYRGTELTELSMRELQTLRGNTIAHVAQDAKKALNPSLTVGGQIAETIRKHQDVTKAEAQQLAIDALADADIADPEYNAEKYPHELSGGQQQRVLLSMALSCNPELLILDEPTTGLDVTTQTKIMDLVEELRDEYETTILLITHNLAVIAQIAERVGIMYAGELMEVGRVEDIFTESTHPYTQSLIAATPKLGSDSLPTKIPGTIPSLTELPDGCIFADRCELAEDACRRGHIEMERPKNLPNHRTRCRRWKAAIANPLDAENGKTRTQDIGKPIFNATNIQKLFDKPTTLESVLSNSSVFSEFIDFEPPVRAVEDVDITLHEGETVGLVGESGSGKSTLGRVLLHLLESDDGDVRYRDEAIGSLSSRELDAFYSECQIVFQNPHSSLNPRKTIREILDKPLRLFTDLDRSQRYDRVIKLLEEVDLGEEYAERYPHELSGGEKQRVAIGRAFAPSPSLIILDEPTSALDVSVQANILNLLADLKAEYSTAYLFISHDLGVVSNISDRIFVMYMGEIVERGTKDEIFNPPHHPYTRTLLSNIPTADPTHPFDPIRMEGTMPSGRDPPKGCTFNTRCPQKIGEVCEVDDPALTAMDTSPTHHVSCHLDPEEMEGQIRSIDEISSE